MHKIDHDQINKLNHDIWALILEAFNLKNWALMQDGISKLRALQKKYIETIGFLDSENRSLKNFLAENQKTLDRYERDWLLKIAKDNNLKEEIKEKINQTYKHLDSNQDEK
jgi:hypothetical protein